MLPLTLSPQTGQEALSSDPEKGRSELLIFFFLWSSCIDCHVSSTEIQACIDKKMNETGPDDRAYNGGGAQLTCQKGAAVTEPFTRILKLRGRGVSLSLVVGVGCLGNTDK